MWGKAQKRGGDNLREMPALPALSPQMWCHTELKRADLPHHGLLQGKTAFDFMGLLMDCCHPTAQTQCCRKWQCMAFLEKDTKSLECGMELHPGSVHVVPTLWRMSRKAQKQLKQNPPNSSAHSDKQKCITWPTCDWLGQRTRPLDQDDRAQC